MKDKDKELDKKLQNIVDGWEFDKNVEKSDIKLIDAAIKTAISYSQAASDDNPYYSLKTGDWFKYLSSLSCHHDSV